MSYPNFKNKHSRQAMFSAKEFMKYSTKTGFIPIKVPRDIIICYSSGLFAYIKKKEKYKSYRAVNGTLLVTRDGIGVFADFGIGAPAVAAALEELIAMGAKRFISIGTAGTLQYGLNAGDIVVCNKAVRDEGVSHHYEKSSKYSYPSKKLFRKILKSIDGKFFVGPSWTIDAPYRETVAEARHYQKQGIMTVEMEASALFTVAKCRKVDLAVILVVSDSLAGLVWNPQFHTLGKTEGLKSIYHMAKKIMSS